MSLKSFYFPHNFCGRGSGNICSHPFLLLGNHPGELSTVVRYILQRRTISWLGRILWMAACNCFYDNGSDICINPVLPLQRNHFDWSKCFIRFLWVTDTNAWFVSNTYMWNISLKRKDGIRYSCTHFWPQVVQSQDNLKSMCGEIQAH